MDSSLGNNSAGVNSLVHVFGGPCARVSDEVKLLEVIGLRYAQF